jgi:hypothetical protein
MACGTAQNRAEEQESRLGEMLVGQALIFSHGSLAVLGLESMPE